MRHCVCFCTFFLKATPRPGRNMAICLSDFLLRPPPRHRVDLSSKSYSLTTLFRAGICPPSKYLRLSLARRPRQVPAPGFNAFNCNLPQSQALSVVCGWSLAQYRFFFFPDAAKLHLLQVPWAFLPFLKPFFRDKHTRLFLFSLALLHRRTRKKRFFSFVSSFG